MRKKQQNVTETRQKKAWYLGWWPVILLCILFWPLGLILLFLKLTDIRREKEASIPKEKFLSYSRDKTAEENEEAIKREKSTLNAIKMTKIVLPLVVLVSGTSLTLNVAYLILNGFQRAVWLELLQSILFLGGAFALAYICYNMSQRQKRFYRYMDIIGANQSFSVMKICTLTGYSTEQVAEDLEEMKKRLYFSKNAYLDLNSMIFYRSVVS